MSSFRKPYTVVRRAPGSYVNGYWEGGPESTFTIRASVQPLRMDEIEALPEGRRSSSAVKIYTDTKLLSARQATENADAVSADILQYAGSEWEIIACATYQSGVIPHYKAYAIEVME